MKYIDKKIIRLLILSTFIFYEICCFQLSSSFTNRYNTRFQLARGLSSIKSIEVSTDTDNDVSKVENINVDGISNAQTDNPKKKVYQPRVDNLRPAPVWGKTAKTSQAPKEESSFRKKSDLVHILENPQLLVKYKAPREVSELKSRLVILQDNFRQQYENSQAEGSSGSSSYSNFDRRSSLDSKPTLASTALPSDGLGFRGAKRNVRSKTGAREENRRDSGGRREKRSDRDDDDDDYYGYNDESLNADPFGTEDDDAFVSLSTLPAGALRQMEDEGLSLDEIQLAIFGEYGIKASVGAIRKRLIDDKSEKRRFKKSGKTRRERNKARQAKNRIDTSNIVSLPKSSSIQVMELASLIGVGGGEVVKHLMMNLGIMVTLNQNVDINTAKSTILSFGKEISSEDDEDDILDEDDTLVENISHDQTFSRPPVVTIMGHVDHGKTTLLDRIRKLSHGESISSNFVPVAPTEAGGITQSISAFKVRTGSDRVVTFIDTPGHAAFSDMRKRGANVTDIVVLVVAADDGVMDQTKECIFAAKAAGCPIVVAVNKIDKEGADAQAVLTDLMSYDILVEEFGGDVQAAKLSAKRGIGIEGLLEKILLQADVMDLKGKLNVKPSGSVIESRIDKRLGTVATVLVQSGNLKVGDILLAGKGWGRVKKLVSDQGEDLKEAGPSTPVQVLGFNSIPSAGDKFITVDEESAARNVAEARLRLARQATASSSMASMISQAASFTEGSYTAKEVIKVPLVLKADVSGSVEALKSSLEALQASDETASCFVDLVQSGIGEVTASDIAIAAVSKAKIVAFNVGVKPNVLELAKSSNVDIGFYSVVYDLLNEIEKQVKETISPPPPGLLIGKAEIKKSFRVGKSGKVAGCTVIEGSIKANSKVRIMRGNRNPVYTGLLSSLRFGKDTISEALNGGECGMSFEDFLDFEEGDIVECFSVEMGI